MLGKHEALGEATPMGPNTKKSTQRGGPRIQNHLDSNGLFASGLVVNVWYVTANGLVLGGHLRQFHHAQGQALHRQ